MTTRDPVQMHPATIHDQPPSLYDIALWPIAREHVANLASARLRRLYGAALDALEEAWSILAPMALAASDVGPGDVIAHVVLDVVEEWRDVAGDRTAYPMGRCCPSPSMRWSWSAVGWWRWGWRPRIRTSPPRSAIPSARAWMRSARGCRVTRPR